MKVCGHLHALAALSLGKELAVPTEYEAGWGPESVWTFLHKSLLPLLGIGLWLIIQPIA